LTAQRTLLALEASLRGFDAHGRYGALAIAAVS
jgi:hypothetical protein